MTWWLIGALAWVAVAVPAALLVGRAIRDADARRAGGVQVESPPLTESQSGNFVATEAPPSEVPPTPWTGPQTVPFPPPASIPRRRSHAIRNPLSRAERNPSHRDSGVF